MNAVEEPAFVLLDDRRVIHSFGGGDQVADVARDAVWVEAQLCRAE